MKLEGLESYDIYYAYVNLKNLLRYVPDFEQLREPKYSYARESSCVSAIRPLSK